ncbi:MAG: right-handed parallel beta-helix repeat-containing protein [Candidatus Thermoplasmatota archaeon]|nr:right-handed parallel beta-helix repeat-containing protein [Candidatus Thermoplasmatota archaeon]
MTAASNGDTIYVYEYSSPYHENITIDKSLHIKGENPTTTIINGTTNEKNEIVNISSHTVHLSDFTIQSHTAWAGIFISKSYGSPWNTKITNITITNTILKHLGYGIFAISAHYSEFANNKINNCNTGIYLGYSTNNQIHHNTIQNSSYYGIETNSPCATTGILNRLTYIISSNNTIIANTLIANRFGIEVGSNCKKTTITDNHLIANKQIGLRLHTATYTTIQRNNFHTATPAYLNYQHATFTAVNRPAYIITNTWNNNYWEKIPEMKVPIHGTYHIAILIHIGFRLGLEINLLDRPITVYDRNPAENPFP